MFLGNDKIRHLNLVRMFLAAINVALLICSLFGVLVLGMWVLSPAYIDKIDLLIVSKYKEHYEKKYISAKSIASKDIEKGILEYGELLSMLETVKKGDRLTQFKKVIYLDLVDVYRRKNDFDKALSLLDSVILFDENDIDLKMKKFDLLLNAPGHWGDAIKYLKIMYEKYPDIEIIKEKYRFIRNLDS